MGVRSIKICERTALELSCDGVSHETHWRSAWFDSGTDLGNFALATAAGWSEGRAEQAWLCPQCARKNALDTHRPLAGMRPRNPTVTFTPFASWTGGAHRKPLALSID